MVVPHWAYPDSQILVSYIVWCLICECLPFMLEYEIVCWVYDMRTFSVAYSLLVCMIVCGFLLCDDHQPCWCEQMWEPLAVVIIIEMLRFDDILDDYRAHYSVLLNEKQLDKEKLLINHNYYAMRMRNIVQN